MDNNKIHHIKIRLNVDLAGNKAGDILTLRAIKGMPLDRYWSRRLKDSVLDRCVEVLESKKKEVIKKSK